MNHKGTKPIDYQTILTLPVKMAFKYQYGLLNNVVHMDIPMGNTAITLNIEVDNINSMEIKKMYATKRIWHKENFSVLYT